VGGDGNRDGGGRGHWGMVRVGDAKKCKCRKNQPEIKGFAAAPKEGGKKSRGFVFVEGTIGGEEGKKVVFAPESVEIIIKNEREKRREKCPRKTKRGGRSRQKLRSEQGEFCKTGRKK